jgi:pimeloyl-ACP methyl ester carboxylesterase
LIPPSEAPAWFVQALARPGSSHFVEVESCAIHYLAWGDPARPGLVFVPPSGGHAHWFSHVAPLLADQFHVVALDPSGCGDSGRREVYTTDLLTAEIAGVCDQAGLFDAPVGPTLIGHSAGAPAVVRAALAHGQRLLGIIAVDGLRYAELDKDHAVKILTGPRAEPRPSRIHPSLEEPLARFRLSPTPLLPIENAFVVEHIARHSFRAVTGGWSSKYDPRQGSVISLALELSGQLKDLECHAAAIYAEHSHLAEADVGDRMGALNDHRVPVFVLPGAHHFPQIDQPFAFVAAIRALALAWCADGAQGSTRRRSPWARA